MFKKKLIISRIFTAGMAASLVVSTPVYAASTTTTITVEEQMEAPINEVPDESAAGEIGNTEAGDSNGAQAGAKQPIDLTKIVTDYLGNSWIPVEGGYARCNPNDGSLLEGYEIVQQIPQAPTSIPQIGQTQDQVEAGGQSEADAQAQAEAEAAVQEALQAQAEAEAQAQAEAEAQAQAEAEAQAQAEAEAQAQAEVEAVAQAQAAAQAAQAQVAGSNESLIANQQIIIPPKIEESFRFVTIAKKYALAKALEPQPGTEEPVLEQPIYEEMDENSRAVGTIAADGLCYVLKEVEPKQNEQEENPDMPPEETTDETKWVYIESGVVRGFIKADNLLMGEEAQNKVTEAGEENMYLAQALIEPFENTALAYTRTTTRHTLAEKVYAISNADQVNIYEGKSTEDRVIGTLSNNALCYILTDADQDWIYVESEDVRGFVSKEYLIQGEEAQKMVEEQGEENFVLAEQLIEPKENKACYYTITSVKEGKIASAIRTSMLTFAQQFLGNPYVWGGTSLTHGADCSGFVQSIYAQYGYSLPRTSREQSVYGTQIPLEEAAPGDLIFYAKNGVVYHVVMYMGNGQAIHASGSKTGIITSGIDMEHAVWATRIIDDMDGEKIDEVNSKAEEKPFAYTLATSDQIGDYLGNFKLTAYCNCAQCSGQWAEGPTASGTIPTQGRTIAMDGVPFGTQLLVNGQIFTVEDRGTPFGHVDVFMNDHQETDEFGVQFANVFLVK